VSPSITVGDKTHEGPSSNDVTVRNNIASNLGIYNPNPNMTMDHNICLAIKGKCQIITYVNGKPDFGVFKPGEYGHHNIIDRRGSEGMFVGFDPAKLVYDLRLKSGAIAIGTGNPEGAPPVDITGAPRGSRVDVGAHQQASGQIGAVFRCSPRRPAEAPGFGGPRGSLAIRPEEFPGSPLRQDNRPLVDPNKNLATADELP
jgi:hypothetical protein